MNEGQKTILVWAALIASVALCLAAIVGYQYVRDHKFQPTSVQSTTQTDSQSPPPKVTCEDVTSYDYNWDNDVLCTNPDGSTFYTDYAGGRKYGYDF